ncbi:MAG: transcriptional repressor [Dehalococcoidia bacterium]|nr:MAG: transcriptional repressor [Dehalococcoidia bacterium]
MSCSDVVERRLRAVGLRVTAQRLAVGEALLHAADHRTAEEVQARLQVESAQPVSLATVYRTLHTLVEHRVVGHLDRGRGSAVYEWLDPQHPHHHALCVDCGVEVEIAPRLLERFGRAVMAESRFTPFLDHLALVGRCAACEAQTRSG